MSKRRKKIAAIRASKAIRGIARQEHFAAGGTTAGWRGTASVETDRKKKRNKNFCRQQEREEQ